MNYLAHLHLAPDDAAARVGNLLGDFLKPSHAGHLPQALQQGMALHRQIDSHTDSHPLVARSKQRIAAERRRYAGILVDIFYDHFLAQHWPRFSSMPLADFTAAAMPNCRPIASGCRRACWTYCRACRPRTGCYPTQKWTVLPQCCAAFPATAFSATIPLPTALTTCSSTTQR
jgi:hypothetical protein